MGAILLKLCGYWLAVLTGVFSILSGCTTRPDVGDVAPYPLDAALVAQAIRCEVRDGFIAIIGEALADTKYEGSLSREHFLRLPPPSSVRKEDVDFWRAKQESDAFDKFLKTDYKAAKKDIPSIEQLVETYGGTFVAYKFEFNMATTDATSGNLDLVSVFTRGTVKTPISSSFEGKRQATRQFVLADRLDQMLINLPIIRVCNQLRAYKRLPNSAYPITGKLDLIRVIRNFGTVNQSGNLIGQYSDTELLKAAQQPPVPTMSEKLIFTTTVKAGVTPTLELAQQAHGTDVSGAGLKLSRERIDTHTLTLIMQLPFLTGPTVANARSAAERNAEIEYQLGATAAATELNRIENDDRNNRLLNIITGQ